MALTIEQVPLYGTGRGTAPVGQDLIFTLKDNTVVGANFNVKFVASIHISTSGINLATSTDLVGTFKTTPNNAGVGIFNVRSILESFVSPDNLGSSESEFKAVPASDGIEVPLHLIDKFSLNDNTLRYLKIRFTVEGSATSGGSPIPIGSATDSNQYNVFNGYVKYTDALKIILGNFGYDTLGFLMGTSGRFLTNAPLTQYANIEDYGTLSFMATPSDSFPVTTTVDSISFKYYDSSDGVLAAETVDNTDANGGYTTYSSVTQEDLLHVGCFPANLQNWSSTFQALVTANTISYYTIKLLDSSNATMSETVRINVNCPTLKGYEPIRLTWLNQWGVWDYYTFNMKSTKTISTKGSTYEQLEGTWNESVYKLNGFKGGKKAFRVNATEKIQMNTDFVSESESEWFEELINSPEVYILKGFATTSTTSLLNQYATPVRLTTSSYTKKTVANDRLMQYTFEVEKSKTLRTQSV